MNNTQEQGSYTTLSLQSLILAEIKLVFMKDITYICIFKNKFKLHPPNPKTTKTYIWHACAHRMILLHYLLCTAKFRFVSRESYICYCYIYCLKGFTKWIYTIMNSSGNELVRGKILLVWKCRPRRNEWKSNEDNKTFINISILLHVNNFHFTYTTIIALYVTGKLQALLPHNISPQRYVH